VLKIRWAQKMRYVKVEAVNEPHPGYLLDADPYLAVLPQIEADLPEGARRFALDEEHYNFFGPRCVKDLRLLRATVSDSNDQISAELEFAPNQFKHDQGLVIRYTNVVEMAIDVTSSPRKAHVWPDSRRLGDLQLDEILPHEQGVSHEIRLTGGVIRFVSSDLHAQWRESENGSAESGGGRGGVS
jgi:hypothetical protein